MVPQTERKPAPFGTWESPISSHLLSARSVSLLGLDVYEPSSRLYHLEGRPAEGGRCCIVEHDLSPSGDITSRDVLPAEYSAQTSIHGYGGTPFIVNPATGDLIFTDGRTKGVYILSPESGEVKPIIDVDPSSPTTPVRYADFHVCASEPNWVLAVEERGAGSDEIDRVIAIEISTKKQHVIAEGADFYSNPRFSADGKRVCWVQWSHPDMPWTGSLLYVADWLGDGKIEKPVYIAGEALKESILEPRWGIDGTLFFVSDRTGYWQLYRLDVGASAARRVNLKGLEEVEFSGRNPALGSYTYASMTATTILAAVTIRAANRLVVIDLKTETFQFLDSDLIEIRFNALRKLTDTKFAIIGSTARFPNSLYELDLANPSYKRLIKTSAEVDPILSTFFSEARHISFPRVYGEAQGEQAHAFFLPPQNPNYQGTPGSLPPLIVWAHGGPSSHVPPGLAMRDQYWTSRGYAVALLNYTGSTGYGRRYRERLDGKWGILDVDDSVSCVEYLASTGQVDRTRAGIMGPSAGGYTVLQALCVYPDVFASGNSEYGVGDLRALAEDTHRFESHYLFGLVFERGGRGMSEDEKNRVYKERSPLFNADKIKSPLLLLQGDADKVVPPNQAKDMEQVIKEKGGDVKLIIFEGEGHGFAQSASVRRAVEETEQWFRRTLVRSE
ncbi:hypothetical protein DTO166G4_1317 [Paecilomyces variotii]|nr:hypothetical protein DTO166G4_1317 [Paecilomyces variotii]KAJ9242316.1 hypothetical protein DTO166G5_719 [Paecilomyces variotii]KAJ9353178.1 hypothetical protein DTO027B9_5430 [Paecilomyces variotii]